MHTGQFTQKRGPLFANLVLADEVNRAPAKVQSALLEAMQERQVTIGDSTHQLPDPFLVLATQNPIEQEGTFPLPEAQLDRFMLLIKVSYPTAADERVMLDRMSSLDMPAGQRGRDDRAGPRRAPDRQLDLHRRPRARLHRPHRAGDAPAARLRARRARAADRVRRLAARDAVPRRGRARARVHPPSRVRHARRHQGDRARRACATAFRSPTKPKPRKSAPRTWFAASSNTCRCRRHGDSTTAELFKKARKIEIASRRLVDTQLAGQYHAVFKGRGLDLLRRPPVLRRATTSARSTGTSPRG